MKKFISLWLAVSVMVICVAALAGNDLGAGITYNKQHGYVVNSTAGDDVWFGDGVYPFPSTAEILISTGSSSNDTSAGTGCRTLKLEGLDSSYATQTETLTLVGTTSTSSVNSYLRLNRAYCETVGSGGTNAGQITVTNTSLAPLAIIPTGLGKSQAAVFTAPSDGNGSFLGSWNASIGKGSVSLSLQMRNTSGPWVAYEQATVHAAGGPVDKHFDNWLRIPKKADVRVRVIGTTEPTSNGLVQTDATLEVMQK